MLFQKSKLKLKTDALWRHAYVLIPLRGTAFASGMRRKDQGKSMPDKRLLIIIRMFIQGNLFSTLSAVINKGPVSKTMIYYNNKLQWYVIK